MVDGRIDVFLPGGLNALIARLVSIPRELQYQCDQTLFIFNGR